ncbi:hypothetical protein ACFWEJ_07285, partial [Promicromonospora sp. NPDC060204]
MTTTETRSALRAAAATAAASTTDATTAGAPADSGHEHAWTTDSRHRTSAGYVLYVRCAACGAHRVDLQPRTDRPTLEAPFAGVYGVNIS